MGRQGVRLSGRQRREVIRLAARGRTKREIIDAVGIAGSSVAVILGPLGGVYRPEQWEPTPGRLGLEDRIEIRAGIAAGESFAGIGRRLGRATSTISREVGGRAGRQQYAPLKAHRRAEERSGRAKPTKLEMNPKLCARVAQDLMALWSPEEISGRLAREFPNDAEMQVSHETIYKTLYVQGRGELAKELHRCLRTGRSKRKTRNQTAHSRIPDPVPISQRPAEVEDRAVPGHWEGDLLMGSKSYSSIATLVERTSRFTVLVPLPEGHTADKVRDGLVAGVKRLPEQLFKTLTWDRGPEMARHADFTIDTGVKVYFCDPRSPWQRPTNENTNGLLRQYLPKNTNLRAVPVERLDEIAASLNTRPRKTLDYMTPSEAFTQLVATTG